HPESSGLLRQEPGVTHVAVERELEIDEQETHLVDVTPETLAGQAMRELVRGGHGKNDEPRHEHHLDTPEASEIAGDVAPLRHSDAKPKRDDGRGENDEGRGE